MPATHYEYFEKDGFAIRAMFRTTMGQTQGAFDFAPGVTASTAHKLAKAICVMIDRINSSKPGVA